MTGSMRETVSSRAFATQTAAAPDGDRRSAAAGLRIALDAAAAVVELGQRAGGGVRDPDRAGADCDALAPPDRIVATAPSPAAARSIRDDGAVVGSRPRRSGGRPRCRRGRCRRSLVDDGVGLRVDLRDGAVEAVRDPDEAAAEGDPGGPVADLDRVDHTCFAGSMRETLCASRFATQSEPAPVVRAVGDAPTVDRALVRPSEASRMPTEFGGDRRGRGGRLVRAAAGGEDDGGRDRGDDGDRRCGDQAVAATRAGFSGGVKSVGRPSATSW